jgi:hypothetical protein
MHDGAFGERPIAPHRGTELAPLKMAKLSTGSQSLAEKFLPTRQATLGFTTNLRYLPRGQFSSPQFPHLAVDSELCTKS